MARYEMTKKAIIMGEYSTVELNELKNITLNRYLIDGEITQDEYDDLILSITTALAV
jgi:hypothetical protein